MILNRILFWLGRTFILCAGLYAIAGCVGLLTQDIV